MIERGPGRELRIRGRTYKGHRFLDIREWSKNETTAEWWPTKGRGISIKPRELADLAKAVDAARALVARVSGAAR